jgi:hypothetical protein
MPSANAFRSSNRNRGGSNAQTSYNVGGGMRKAGLPPRATGPYNQFFSYRNRGLPQSFAFMMLNADGTANVSTACVSRNVGAPMVATNVYFKCPGLPR